MNLVWALIESGALRVGRPASPAEATRHNFGGDNASEVAVVGAGLAGLTAAAGLARHGCRVDIYDESRDIMHLQRGNGSRYLHPNIYNWPEDDSQSPNTRLPFLNWSAGTAGEVVSRIAHEWKWLVSDYCITERLGHKVVGIQRSGRRRLRVTCNPSPRPAKSYDAVILCTGFGIERRFDHVSERSYWRDDSLHQDVLEEPMPRRFLVTGIGDGGIADVLRLRLRDFDPRMFIEQLVELAAINPNDIRRSLREYDKEARESIDDGCTDVSSWLYSQYCKLLLPESLTDYFKDRLRTDTHVTIVGRSAHPLSMRAQTLHRFAMFLLLRAEQRHLEYYPGELDLSKDIEFSAERAKYIVKAPKVLRVAEAQFDHLVIRHGVKPPLPLHDFAERSQPESPRYAGQMPSPVWRPRDREDFQSAGYLPADPALAAVLPSPWNTAPMSDLRAPDSSYGTYFGSYVAPDELPRTSLTYRVHFVQYDKPVAGQRLNRGEGHNPYMHPLFAQRGEGSDYEYLFPNAVPYWTNVCRVRRFLQQEEYKYWLIIDDEKLENNDVHIGLERDGVIGRELVSVPKNDPGIRDEVRFETMAKRIVEYIRLQDFDPHLPRLVTARIDGVDLRVKSVRYAKPSPLVEVIFSRPSKSSSARNDYSWEPERDHVIECECWGLHNPSRGFPIVVPGSVRLVDIALHNNVLARRTSRPRQSDEKAFELTDFIQEDSATLGPETIGPEKDKLHKMLKKIGLEHQDDAENLRITHGQRERQGRFSNATAFISLDVQGGR